MDEKKEQLEKVRRAFRDPYLRGWIPNYLLTILEQGEDTEDILSKMEQVMPKYCVPRKFETEEQQSLDEGSERQNENDFKPLNADKSGECRYGLF